MMAFRTPWVLSLLAAAALLAAIYAWSRWKRLRDLKRLGDWRLIAPLVNLEALQRRKTKDKVAFVAFVLVILSAAGPQFGSRLKEVKQRGVDVFIALDTSRSMLAEDVAPSRLERAKRSLGALITRLEGNRIGIVAFAGQAFTQCPLTIDTEAAKLFLEILDQNAVPRQGTVIGDAIRTAVKSFPKDSRSGKAIVLLTDGEDHSSNPMDAAREAKEAGVVIFTIGIGTTKGDVIKNRDDQGQVTEFHKYKGEMVLSRLDDALLTKIAVMTGGQYYRASSSDREIDEIADILNGFDKREFASKIHERLQERYQIFLFIAVLLLLFEFFFGERPGQVKRVRDELSKMTASFTWRRKKKEIKTAPVAAALLFLVLLVPAIAQADYKTHIRKGNQLLRKGDAEGARAEFESAAIDAPEAAFIPYNTAVTYYVEGNLDEAQRQFERAYALSSDPHLKSQIAYNLGHVLFNQNQRDQAIDKFKECLRLNPQDKDAKYNIEYIRSGGKPEGAPQKSPDKNKDSNKDNKDKGEGDQNDQDKDQQDQQNQAENEKKPGELSKEDAERVLQMIQDQEGEKMKARPITPKGEQPKTPPGEDW